MVKKHSRWIKGDYNTMSSDEMHRVFAEVGKGVEGPTALETHKKKKAWRLYHKPIQPGEFWD